ncbi:DUF2252 family protein [Streptomyces tropicalis]|uniref:DUF2252 family protein n=1 Tax=Streptomyces tropicalis TaxID=3034234 RepID=UPI0028BEE758|nr:DUF2252 family protein [Streptomyces tropicalis]
MAASPSAFLRGAAAVMTADLAAQPHTGLTFQLCKDAHLLNFGLQTSSSAGRADRRAGPSTGAGSAT